ncbi:MAG: hypothetical protein Q8P57_02265 [Candidatus Pacearchaeota archaeon]|nr:hypothetical protein [Candidatus Pacearchaeota archaeon]
MFLKNRKGEKTAEDITEIVIAVIGIVLIISLIVLLANFFEDQTKKNAKNFIKGLDSKIENLGVGEEGNFVTQGVDGWYLTGWGKGEKDRPSKCFFNSCLCVCPEADPTSCQEKGVCRPVDEENVFVSSKFSYKISNSGEGSVFAKCISLSKLLSEINVLKSQGNLRLETNFGIVTLQGKVDKFVDSIEMCEGFVKNVEKSSVGPTRTGY